MYFIQIITFMQNVFYKFTDQCFDRRMCCKGETPFSLAICNRLQPFQRFAVGEISRNFLTSVFLRHIYAEYAAVVLFTVCKRRWLFEQVNSVFILSSPPSSYNLLYISICNSISIEWILPIFTMQTCPSLTMLSPQSCCHSQSKDIFFHLPALGCNGERECSYIVGLHCWHKQFEASVCWPPGALCHCSHISHSLAPPCLAVCNFFFLTGQLVLW